MRDARGSDRTAPALPVLGSIPGSVAYVGQRPVVPKGVYSILNPGAHRRCSKRDDLGRIGSRWVKEVLQDLYHPEAWEGRNSCLRDNTWREETVGEQKAGGGFSREPHSGPADPHYVLGPQSCWHPVLQSPGNWESAEIKFILLFFVVATLSPKFPSGSPCLISLPHTIHKNKFQMP